MKWKTLLGFLRLKTVSSYGALRNACRDMPKYYHRNFRGSGRIEHHRFHEYSLKGCMQITTKLSAHYFKQFYILPGTSVIFPENFAPTTCHLFHTLFT